MDAQDDNVTTRNSFEQRSHRQDGPQTWCDISPYTLAFSEVHLERSFQAEFAQQRRSLDWCVSAFSSAVWCAGYLRHLQGAQVHQRAMSPGHSAVHLLARLLPVLLQGALPPAAAGRLRSLAMHSIRIARCAAHATWWLHGEATCLALAYRVFDFLFSPAMPLLFQLPFKQYLAAQLLGNAVLGASMLVPSSTAAAVALLPASPSCAAAAAEAVAAGVQSVGGTRVVTSRDVCSLLARGMPDKGCARLSIVLDGLRSFFGVLAGALGFLPLSLLSSTLAGVDLRQQAGALHQEGTGSAEGAAGGVYMLPAAPSCRQVLWLWLLLPSLVLPGAYLYLAELRARQSFLRSRCGQPDVATEQRYTAVALVLPQLVACLCAAACCLTLLVPLILEGLIQ